MLGALFALSLILKVAVAIYVHFIDFVHWLQAQKVLLL